MGMMEPTTRYLSSLNKKVLFATLLSSAVLVYNVDSYSTTTTSSSAFHGRSLQLDSTSTTTTRQCNDKNYLTMRKQKASDRRTRRRQRGWEEDEEIVKTASTIPSTLTRSPMTKVGQWKQKRALTGDRRRGSTSATGAPSKTKTGGRGRSRKRSTLYNSLAYYHNHFLNLLTNEYQAEEEEVLGRIKASIDDGNPVGLEAAGFALYDLYPERRGNLFSDEVYRLTKAGDATTAYKRSSIEEDKDDDDYGNKKKESRDDGAATKNDEGRRYLPPNHKFAGNDVVVLTLQPGGSGDYFGPSTLPTSDDAVSAECRVLNSGPTYVDVAMPAGSFEAVFGPAPNDNSGSGDRSMRVRADRFVSNVPYQRMVAAVAKLTAIPDRQQRSATPEEAASAAATKGEGKPNPHDNIKMDELLREVILSTHAFTDPHSPLLRDPDVCDLQELSLKLSKPPMGTSPKLARQALKYIKANPQIFPKFNAPQLTAIEAALTRRMTMVHGPPGTGKTSVAAAIALGFARQCRTISPHTKVLACAFSNVGADNLAEAAVRLGLKVVRVGKASAVSESLWDCTLDAAIHRDPDAQKAIENAARATAQLNKINKRRGKAPSGLSDQTIRDAATSTVKKSIEACNIAATKFLRTADVIVSTSTGSADPRLLAACGVVTEDTDNKPKNYSPMTNSVLAHRENAPDNLPPLSLPFVIVDEACQSVEPATLVPITSTDSCRSLVLLGDPCQLPPTVRIGYSTELSISLMERLSATLLPPTVSSRVDNTSTDKSYLDSLPIKQANSLLRSMDPNSSHRSYRKRFSGSLLLSIQYRMHPSIAALPSSIFYDGQLATPTFLANQRSFPKVLQSTMPCGNPNLCVRAIDVSGQCNERQGSPTNRYSRTVFASSTISETPRSALSLEEQTTYWNEPEAIRLLSLIKDMLKERDDTINSIGVISPYNGQVQLIKSMIASDAELRELLLKSPVTIEVKSVDGYQGRERDVVIFSAVRSNRQANIGFLRDWRRMNVALTRAKSALLVIGDFQCLANSDRHWAAFSKWASGAGAVVDESGAPEDKPCQ